MEKQIETAKYVNAIFTQLNSFGSYTPKIAEYENYTAIYLTFDDLIPDQKMAAGFSCRKYEATVAFHCTVLSFIAHDRKNQAYKLANSLSKYSHFLNFYVDDSTEFISLNACYSFTLYPNKDHIGLNALHLALDFQTTIERHLDEIYEALFEDGKLCTYDPFVEAIRAVHGDDYYNKVKKLEAKS